jgi:DNA-binding NarL/FixJ family response regulator
MRSHLFITYRAEPLPGWLEAFPGAEVRRYPEAGMPVDVGDGRKYLLWVHLKHGENALAQLNAASRLAPGAPRIVLSNMPGVEQGLAVLEAGAAGFTSALAIPQMLQQVARVVENGGLWVGPDILEHFLATLASRPKQAPATSVLASLSPRQRDVALAVAAGASNKEIAKRLDITERTVKAHISAVLETLGVRDRLQLALLVNGTPTRG